MTLWLFVGILAATPCDGVSFEIASWPAQVSVTDLITCIDDLAAGNCPVADAGREQFATTNTAVSLDGTNSLDDGVVRDFTWTQVNNGAPPVVINNANDMTASVVPTTAGTYVFELAVRQGCLTDRDTVRVVVADQIAPPQTLTFSLIADASSLPTPMPFTPAQVQQAPGQPNRLYILTLEGRIWIRDNGTILPQPYIDVSSLISGCFECNLMSMAFHPDFAVNGMVYIKYVGNLLDGSGSNIDVRVAGFSPGLNPDVLTLGDGVDLLTIAKPTDIHAGGSIVFGRDGHLYMGNGDSGPQNDPNGNAQNTMLLNGKILRYQVNGLNPLTIPATNPFLDDANVADPIYAIGFRNPWRVSVDRDTGDFFIGDNGQNDVEEVSFLSGEGIGGQNFGWNVMEGNQCFNPPQGCDTTGLEPPIWDYSHATGCSVIGGYVYRGAAVPAMAGFYLYGDWCPGQLFILRFEEGQWINRQVNVQGAPGLTGTALVGFGEDQSGELYMCTGGDVYQLTGTAP